MYKTSIGALRDSSAAQSIGEIMPPTSGVRGSLRYLVSRKLRQRRRHVLDCGRTILGPDGPVCVAGDVVRHSLAYPNSVGDLLEHVTPSVSAELRLSGAGERICETSLLLVLVLPEMHPADCFKNIE
jgi:hypothetical protein